MHHTHSPGCATLLPGWRRSLAAHAGATSVGRWRREARRAKRAARVLGAMLGPRWGCDGTDGVGICSPLRLNQSWSQFQEDIHIAGNYFCDVCPEQRVYLEIGALDGVRFSNTLMLEKQFNFGGLLIEGHPVSARCLVQARGSSGRNVIVNEARAPQAARS